MRTQRRRWQHNADRWEDHSSAALERVVDRVLAEIGPGPFTEVLDVGCGGGALTIPLATRAERVVAVDISPHMISRLAERAADTATTNVEARVAAVEELDFPPGSLDLVTSNYALHHLLDRDKRKLVENAAIWLRPGGRMVIGDMMLGRGGDPDDRAIIAAKVRVLARRGPGGWWRVAKNAWRYLSRTVERPLSATSWEELLRSAGFGHVSAERVVAEAAIVSGTRP